MGSLFLPLDFAVMNLGGGRTGGGGRRGAVGRELRQVCCGLSGPQFRARGLLARGLGCQQQSFCHLRTRWGLPLEPWQGTCPAERFEAAQQRGGRGLGSRGLGQSPPCDPPPCLLLGLPLWRPSGGRWGRSWGACDSTANVQGRTRQHWEGGLWGAESLLTAAQHCPCGHAAEPARTTRPERGQRPGRSGPPRAWRNPHPCHSATSLEHGVTRPLRTRALVSSSQELSEAQRG